MATPVALVVLPFIAGAVGAGPALGWLAGLAIIVADWRSGLSQLTWRVAALAGVTAAAIGPVWFRGTAYHVASIALAVTGAVIVFATDRLSDRAVVVSAVVASLAGLSAAVLLDPGGYLDVGLMHRAGSEALRAGVSPWSGLSVPSGAPGSEGTFITGDPYPPVTLVWYSILDWVTGDPRAGGALAWASIALACLLIPTSNPRPLVLLLTSAALPVHLWTGWTELLTLALISWAVVLWHRPVAASIVLGTALASKQYMITWAPLILLNRLDRRGIRSAFTIATAGALAVVGFALGEGYLDAIIGAYGRFEARQDSASLFGALSILGLSVAVPFWLGPVVGVAVSTALAVLLPARDVLAMLLTGSTVLTTLFLLGTQAFSNYWFLVWAILIVSSSLPSTRTPAPASSTRET